MEMHDSISFKLGPFYPSSDIRSFARNVLNLQNQSDEVKVFNGYIWYFFELHKTKKGRIDWDKICLERPPQKNLYEDSDLKNFIEKVRNKKYSLFQRVLLIDKIDNVFDAYHIKSKSKRLNSINAKIQRDYQSWSSRQQLAKAALSKTKKGLLDVLENLQPFSNTSNLCKSILFGFVEDTMPTVKVKVFNDDIVVPVYKAYTPTGRISTKQFSQKQIRDFYKEYVFSATLRIACDIFNTIPISVLHVSVVVDGHNSVTGISEEQKILDVRFTENLLSCQLENVDTELALMSFTHKYEYSKSGNFIPFD